MAKPNNVITQSDVQAVKAYEQLLADNFAAHANASLSKAHGIEFVYTVGLVDADGNDLSTYQDSNGDVVGTAMMRLTDPFSLFSYFVPLNGSTLAGQDVSTGVATPITSAGVQGDSAWITDLSTEALASLSAANDTLLLPHTRLAHWQTHTGGNLYGILPQNTFDSAHHLVAEYVAVFIYKGKKLLIPCSRRLGGPLQPPRILNLTPSTASLHTTGSSGDYGIYFSPTVSGGTKPMTFAYYYNTNLPADINSTNWAGPIIAGSTQNVRNSNGDSDFQFYYDSATGAAHIINGGGGGGELRLKLEVTSPTGVTQTLYGTNNLATFIFYFSHSSECWFCTEGHKFSKIPYSQWKTLFKLAEPAEALCPLGVAFYFEHGHELVTRMYEGGEKPEDFYNYVQSSIQVAATAGLTEAAAFQVDYIHKACAKYWPDCPHYAMPERYRLSNQS